MQYRITIILSLLMALNVLGQEPKDKGLQAISVSTVEAPLKFLASDWTEGREMGTRGAYMAADYIASVFQMYDIKPLGDMAVKPMNRERGLKGEKKQSYRSYFQNFDLLTGPRKAEQSLSLEVVTGFSSKTTKLTEGVDFSLNKNLNAMTLDAPVVFLGYGVESKELKSDPYQQVDLKGKIAFILSGFAGIKDKDSENYKTLQKEEGFSVRQLENEKMEKIRKAGALAVVIYTPGSKLQAESPSNLPMSHDFEYYEGDKPRNDFYLKKLSLPNADNNQDLPEIKISEKVADIIVSESGNSLSAMLEPDYKMGSFKVKEPSGSRFSLKIERDQKVIRVRNVLGYIEGENPNEVIVIGGHYDHVGKYDGFIFNGADDNASGTAGVLTLARAFHESGKKPAKTIVFAAWTGEEQGLWGAKYFVKNVPDNLKVGLNINLDMIGRTYIKEDSEAYLSMQYTKSHASFERIFSEMNKQNKLGLDIRYKADETPKGASDFVPFAKEGIPVISLFTGLHRDYHMPNDELEFIDLEKMTNIIKLTYLGLNGILEEE